MASKPVVGSLAFQLEACGGAPLELPTRTLPDTGRPAPSIQIVVGQERTTDMPRSVISPKRPDI